MKSFKSLLVAMVIIAAVAIVSCKDNKTKTTEKQGTEYRSAYVCPMHCKESGSDKEGKCGTCGMTLVKNGDHKANGHTHN